MDLQSALSSLGFEESEESKNAPAPQPVAGETVAKDKQELRLGIERKGRGGKTVTLVRGFRGSLQEMEALCKTLKTRCGVGGSVKDDEIIIQGDLRPKLLEILRQEGYSRTK